MPISRRRAPAPPARATRGASWQRFTRRLAEALELLEDGYFLILSVRDRHRFVQFAGSEDDGLRAECVSNHYLAKGDRLGAAEHQLLRKLGWSLPTQRPRGSGSVGPAEGSPNWLRVFQHPVDATAAAELAVRTFTEVYGVRDPSAMQYQAFEADGGEVYFPGLLAPREEDMETEHGDHETAIAADAMTTSMEEALLHACDDDGVTRHTQSHWSLTVDGIEVQLFREETLPLARIVAPLWPAASLAIDVHALLNRINAERLSFGYVYERDGEVRLAAEVMLEPFHPAQLVLALQLVAAAARGILLDEEIDALDDLGENGVDPRDN